MVYRAIHRQSLYSTPSRQVSPHQLFITKSQFEKLKFHLIHLREGNFIVCKQSQKLSCWISDVTYTTSLVEWSENFDLIIQYSQLKVITSVSKKWSSWPSACISLRNLTFKKKWQKNDCSAHTDQWQKYNKTSEASITAVYNLYCWYV